MVKNKLHKRYTCTLKKKLNKLGFDVSEVDKCVFYKKGVIFTIYIDDRILFIKDPSQFEELCQAFTNKFEVEKKGDMEQVLGMKFTKEVNEINIT